MLSSGRIAGLREHRGQVIGRAAWRPIITAEQRRRILGRLEDQAVSDRRTPRRYLLTGLLRCGRCGNTLFSSARRGTRRYVCLSGPDHGGCGRLTVVAAPLEALIAETVLYRLDTPALAAALAGRAAADTRTASLAQQIDDDRSQLDELAGLYAAKEITAPEWLRARKNIEARLHGSQRLLARQTRSEALSELVGSGEQLRSAWSGVNLTRQHAVVAALLDYATIAPGTTGARALDPNRVVPHWRL